MEVPTREKSRFYPSIELARKAAIAWLEERGIVIDARGSQILIGRPVCPPLVGRETGVGSAKGARPYWKLYLDHDPIKGAHFNAEFGKGPNGERCAFRFPGGEALIKALARSRSPR